MIEYYLQHHGIKGQKWGVRNGPPYPLNGERGDRKPQKRYGNRSINIDQSTIKKGAFVASAVLVGIGAMYISKEYGYNNVADFVTDAFEYEITKKAPVHISEAPESIIKNGKEIVDISKLNNSNGRTLKPGTKISRISSKSVEDYSREGSRIYASFENKDVNLYKQVLPGYIKEWGRRGVIDDDGKSAYLHTFKTNKEIKIPSERKMYEMYLDTFGLDSSSPHTYRSFIDSLAGESNEDALKYYRHVKLSGYNAIYDLNDKGWANSPIILLNPGDDLEGRKTHKIGYAERYVASFMT